MPIANKKSKANFLANVRKCKHRDDERISLKRVQLFSKRARSYMNAYYKLAHSLVEGKEFEDGDESLTHVKIEKLVKARKPHRCAMDFDAKFIAENSPHR